MDDRTKSFDETYEPESYEWDYEEAADRPPRVLWGRVVALIVLLFAAFWLGRETVPSGDISAAALAEARVELEQAHEDIEELEAQVAGGALPDPTPEPEPTTDETPAATTEGETYIVKSGDSLAAIALKFYGDASLADFIAEANDISDPADIRPGDELIIPPEPD